MKQICGFCDRDHYTLGDRKTVLRPAVCTVVVSVKGCTLIQLPACVLHAAATAHELAVGVMPSATLDKSIEVWPDVGRAAIDDEPGIEDVEKTHPGFTVICQKCQSQRVIVDSSVGFSSTSGAWGSVDLECVECKTTVEIWKPY